MPAANSKKPTPPSTAAHDRAYKFDAIGNRKETANGLLTALTGTDNYAANSKNEYTDIPGSVTPAYDADGNMLTGLAPGKNGRCPRWLQKNLQHEVGCRKSPRLHEH